MELYREEEGRHGIRFGLVPDEEPWASDPRDWDNVGRFYVLASDHHRPDEATVAVGHPDEGYVHAASGVALRAETWEPAAELVRERDPGAVILPVWLSGAQCYVSDYAGASALYVVAGEKVASEWEGDRERAEACARGELETYAAWLRGDVCGWAVVDADGRHIDSCYGYVGEEDYPLSEARSAAAWWAEVVDWHEAELEADVTGPDLSRALAAARELAA